MVVTLYQATEWLLSDTLDIDFCEDLQALCHRIKEINRQLWAVKGSARWGDYVRDVLVVIDDEIPGILDEFRQVGKIEGNGTIRRRYITRAFNGIAKIREALAEVNPPEEDTQADLFDRRATAQIEALLEEWQLRRYGDRGDEEVQQPTMRETD